MKPSAAAATAPWRRMAGWISVQPLELHREHVAAAAVGLAEQVGGVQRHGVGPLVPQRGQQGRAGAVGLALLRQPVVPAADLAEALGAQPPAGRHAVDAAPLQLEPGVARGAAVLPEGIGVELQPTEIGLPDRTQLQRMAVVAAIVDKLGVQGQVVGALALGKQNLMDPVQGRELRTADRFALPAGQQPGRPARVDAIAQPQLGPQHGAPAGRLDGPVAQLGAHAARLVVGGHDVVAGVGAGRPGQCCQQQPIATSHAGTLGGGLTIHAHENPAAAVACPGPDDHSVSGPGVGPHQDQRSHRDRPPRGVRALQLPAAGRPAGRLCGGPVPEGGRGGAPAPEDAELEPAVHAGHAGQPHPGGGRRQGRSRMRLDDQQRRAPREGGVHGASLHHRRALSGACEQRHHRSGAVRGPHAGVHQGHHAAEVHHPGQQRACPAHQDRRGAGQRQGHGHAGRRPGRWLRVGRCAALWHRLRPPRCGPLRGGRQAADHRGPGHRPAQERPGIQGHRR
mmetsp:Transcript_21620/g.51378  ORF Transcript_21620/g.51378 Transcript_21620/m.51378 type:complete len:509 (+) Transcript_21620:1956-3482(+)